MSEKEVNVDKSLLDDGSYLEEEPKNNKILFIVLGVVIATLPIEHHSPTPPERTTIYFPC